MPTTKPIISLEDLKCELPIASGNVEFDVRLNSYISTATRQIEGVTKRFFTEQPHKEFFNSRSSVVSRLNLTGTETFSAKSFLRAGSFDEVKEQTLTLGGFPVDSSKTIEVRYDSLREFDLAGAVVPSDNVEVDDEASRLIVRWATGRRLRGFRVDYTAGFAVPVQVVTPTTYDLNNKDASVTLSNGDLTAAHSGAGTGSAFSLASQVAGKYVVEFTVDVSSASPATNMSVGFAKTSAGTGVAIGNGADSYGYFGDGTAKNNAVNVVTGLSTWDAGDVITIYLDLDNGLAWFAKNGVLENSATLAEVEAGDATNAIFTGLSGTFQFGTGDANGIDSATFTANFGASSFTASTPTGFSSGFGELDDSSQNLSASAPDDLKRACQIQAQFLWKKLDPENVGSRSNKKQAVGAGLRTSNFIALGGVTPEAAALLTRFQKLLRGSG